MIVHELAKYFPILEGEEFDLLVQDIKEHGQLEPIILCDGEILDGVNRYNACMKLGIDSIVEEYKGDDPLSYVISLNIRRRHLTESQRGMLGQEMKKEVAKQIKEEGAQVVLERHKIQGSFIGNPTDKIIAKTFGVGEATVRRAAQIKKEAPERVSNIIKGKESVRAVDAELRQARAAKSVAEDNEKATEKKIKQNPKFAKEYLDATNEFKGQIKFAIKFAERELFAPEAKQFIINRHNQIKGLMTELEETV